MTPLSFDGWTAAMNFAPIGAASPASPINPLGRAARSARNDATALRDRLGEFVGGVFIEPVLKQMQHSPFKTKYLDGGRGEAVFQGQLAGELARRVGRAMADGFGRHLQEAVRRAAGDDHPHPSPLPSRERGSSHSRERVNFDGGEPTREARAAGGLS